MPASFVDLAQTCAPFVASETLAGVVSLESRFAPFSIRVNSGLPLKKQPDTKAEAIEIAKTLATEHKYIQLGLGGIGLDELEKLKLTISDAFDPCLNLKATATLLDGYYRLAVKAGADERRSEQVMLQSFYGRDDPSIGAMVNYDNQVRNAIERLRPTMATLTIGKADDAQSDEPASSTEDVVAEVVAENSARMTPSNSTAPSWDVFHSRRQSSIIVFQNKHGAE